MSNLGKIGVFITTYNRPDMCYNLLKQLEIESKTNDLVVKVYNDCSTDNYEIVERIVRKNGWKYEVFNQNHGKRKLWEVINKAFQDMEKEAPKWVCRLEDDLLLCDDFFQTVEYYWDSIRDCRKIMFIPRVDVSDVTNSKWTKIQPVEVGEVRHIGWVDGVWLAPKTTMERLEWKMNPIDSIRWDLSPHLSSGVGYQMTTRLGNSGTFWQPKNSMVDHLGSVDSQLNKNERVRNNLPSFNFKKNHICGMPKITISMSYYGTDELILKTVKSLLNQTFKDFRLIILNDGGDPNKVWVPLSSVHDPRVIRFNIKENSGTYFAHALSLASCDTEFWLPHDSDDISKPDRLEKLMKHSIQNDVVFNEYEKINVNGEKIPHKSFPLWSALYKTEFLKSIGGINPTRRVGFDSVLVHLSRKLGKTHVIKEELYSYMLRPKSLTVDGRTGEESPIRRDALEYENTILDLLNVHGLTQNDIIRRIIDSQIPFHTKQTLLNLSKDLGNKIKENRSNGKYPNSITKSNDLKETQKNERYDELIYWESRYSSGGDSGSGSGGKEAEWKINEISDLINKLQIKSIVDIGCGDGRIARSIMSRHPSVTYVGIDISPTAVSKCTEAALPNMKHVQSDCVTDDLPEADLVLCLDVLTHISTKERQETLEKKIADSSLVCSYITHWSSSTIFNPESIKAKHIHLRPHITHSLMNSEIKKITPNPRKIAVLCHTRKAKGRPFRIGSLASIGSRMESLNRVVASMRSQVDRLCVYLNNYKEFPDFLDGCVIARSQEHGDIGDTGKIFWCESFGEGNYRILLDDDLNYPKDYVNSLVTKLRSYNNKAVVGLHGVTISGKTDYYKERVVIHFSRELSVDTYVHLLGTGTVAYFDKSISIKKSNFLKPNMADMWLAKLGQEQQVPFIALSRSEMWCWENPGTSDDSIYRAAKTQTKSAKNTSEDQNTILKKLWPWKIHK